MNSKLEFAIAQFRCINKPVKQIAKTLGIKKDVIEKIIKYWIADTDPFIINLVGKREVHSIPDTGKMVILLHNDIDKLLAMPEILDYIAKKRGDHHDRFMDCLRYKIKMKISASEK
ncbi:MAG: hypothetical protein QXZ44_06490 [Ferroplasma sp.]